MSRLIDADALLELYADRLEKLEERYGVHSSECGVLAGAMKLLEIQPTIEPERKKGRWIPVSDRLPEEDDYKSCIECLDGAVWYFTENGAMGIGYYYKSTKEWSTTDDLKTDGKVVAWMPLPEPYREEGEK